MQHVSSIPLSTTIPLSFCLLYLPALHFFAWQHTITFSLLSVISPFSSHSCQHLLLFLLSFSSLSHILLSSCLSFPSLFCPRSLGRATCLCSLPSSLTSLLYLCPSTFHSSPCCLLPFFHHGTYPSSFCVCLVLHFNIYLLPHIFHTLLSVPLSPNTYWETICGDGATRKFP